MTILIFGGTGYLGGEVARQAAASGRTVLTPSSSEVDITDRATVAAYLNSVRPEVVVNAAYRNTSWTICADGAAHVALAAAQAGARLIHLSTDALHAGRDTPYQDEDPPTPVHAYGAAKAAAETAVAAIDPSAALLRTSLIIGDERSKQITLALDMITGRSPGALFTDEIRCPVAVQDLAAAVLELAGNDYAGLLNVAGPEALNRAEMGRMVARAYGLDPARVPTGTIAGGGLGARPADVRLDSSRATDLLDVRLRPASEVLAALHPVD